MGEILILGISGPPESMREHVVAASKAMKKGNWKQCKDYILAVKVHQLCGQILKGALSQIFGCTLVQTAQIFY